MKNLFLFLLVVCSLTAKCQLLNSVDLYNKVVLLKNHQGTADMVATGFILTDGNEYFLVTAKHVAERIKIESALIMCKNNFKSGVGIKVQDLTTGGIKSGFNNKSDCYILNLQPTNDMAKQIIKNTALPVDILLDTDEALSRQVDVLVMGYPIYDLNNFSPITFKSYFASSLINVQLDDKKAPTLCYLLENPNMDGFSGAPVFVSVKDRCSFVKDKTYIAGIVSGVTGDNTGAKYSVITPAYQLVDVIYAR